MKITHSQQSVLVSALLFKGVPIVYNASATALKREGLIRASSIGNLVLTGKGKVMARNILKRLMAKVVLGLALVMGAPVAQADTQLVLQQGQCAQVDGQNYCWFYRPSTWDHPELPPRPCDFRRDCPLTLLIPTTLNSGNLISGPQAQYMNNMAAQANANPNVTRFCREVEKDKFVLVQVEVKDGKKTEVVLNEYGDDRRKCYIDETRIGSSSGTVTSTNGAVIIDTYQVPAPCPYTFTRTTQNVNTVRAKDAWKNFKKIFE